MAWAKQSAKAGLVGLTEREAARGALCEEAFQFMPTPHVRPIVVVSKFKSRLILHVFNVEDVEDKYLQSTVYLIYLDDGDDDDWVERVPDPQNRKEEKKSFLVISCIFVKVVFLFLLLCTIQCTMCNTQCMSKTLKILKCTCIDFRRSIQINTTHGLSWGQRGALR